MVGSQGDPGLMVLSLKTIFDLIKKDNSSDAFEVTCSYLEVYNEVELADASKYILFDVCSQWVHLTLTYVGYLWLAWEIIRPPGT